MLPSANRSVDGSGLKPSSSLNSRRAALSSSSPGSTSPLGMLHTPASRRVKYGPPGCASRKRPSGSTINKPALTLGTLRLPLAGAAARQHEMLDVALGARQLAVARPADIEATRFELGARLNDDRLTRRG